VRGDPIKFAGPDGAGDLGQTFDRPNLEVAGHRAVPKSCDQKRPGLKPAAHGHPNELIAPCSHDWVHNCVALEQGNKARKQSVGRALRPLVEPARDAHGVAFEDLYVGRPDPILILCPLPLESGGLFVMRRAPVQPVEGAPSVAPSLTSIVCDGSRHRERGVTAAWPADLRLE
jgi:hypothetical protein